MAPQLFHLEGASLEELKAQAAALHGPRALIVSAEIVTVGGIRGVFARRHYEIVVEVPDDARPAGVRPRGRRSAVPQASGIDALLQQAELDEVRLAGIAPAGPGGAGPGPGPARATAPRPTGAGRREEPVPAAVSTDSGLFAALMDNLTFATDPAPVAPAPVAPAPVGPAPGPAAPAPPVVVPSAPVQPVVVPGTVVTPAAVVPGPAVQPSAPDAVVPPLTVAAHDPAELPDLAGHVVREPAAPAGAPAVLGAPGDLVTVVGSPAAGWEVVQAMAAGFRGGVPSAVAVAGGVSGWLRPDARRIEDHLDANAARAAGVDGGHPVFLAVASGDPVTDSRLLLALRPDQVWLAVDAGRKEADTAAWVGALRRSMERAGLEPAGLAVVGRAATSTPDTVHDLGLPVGWQDGPAGRTRAAGRRRAEPTGIE